MKTAKFTLSVEYDPEATDPESLARALDILLESATDDPTILDDYGNPKIGEVFPVPDED